MSQLIELQSLFKRPNIVQTIKKLSKFRDELQKFRVIEEENDEGEKEVP